MATISFLAVRSSSLPTAIQRTQVQENVRADRPTNRHCRQLSRKSPVLQGISLLARSGKHALIPNREVQPIFCFLLSSYGVTSTLKPKERIFAPIFSSSSGETFCNPESGVSRAMEYTITCEGLRRFNVSKYTRSESSVVLSKKVPLIFPRINIVWIIGCSKIVCNIVYNLSN